MIRPLFAVAMALGFILGAVGSVWLLERGRLDIVVLIAGFIVAGLIWCAHWIRKSGGVPQ